MHAIIKKDTEILSIILSYSKNLDLNVHKFINSIFVMFGYL